MDENAIKTSKFKIQQNKLIKSKIDIFYNSSKEIK